MRTFFHRAADILLRRRRDHRLDEELRLHLELLEAELTAGGYTPEAARLEARRRFGNLDRVRIEYRRQRGVPLADALRQDVGFAVRLFARDRVLAATIVAALGLGIGAVATVFTILNAMLLQDVPYFREPDRVVAIDSLDGRGRTTGVSFADFLDWRVVPAFRGVSAYAAASATLADGNLAATRLNGVYVSAGTFELLGATPALGRSFTAADDQAGAPLTVVLGYGVWSERYGGDPTVLGRSVSVDGRAATIIAVMPAGFTFPLVGDLWLPVAHLPALADAPRDRRNLLLVARLADGVGLEQARAQLTTTAAALARQYPATNEGVRAVMVPFVSRYLGSFTTPEPLLLFSAVVLLLLLACANASTLLLTRAASRAREIALRTVLGASRRRVLAQLLVESLLLTIVGGAAGVALAQGAVRWFASTTGELGLPPWVRFQMDLRVLGTIAAICLGTAAVFGFAPALHLTRRATPVALKDGGRGLAGAAHRGRWMRLLLGVQVALAIILLSGAAGLVHRALQLRRADRAVQPASVLAGRLTMPNWQGVDADGRRRFAASLVDTLRAVPGVTAVGMASALPFVRANLSPFEWGDEAGTADDRPQTCVVGMAGDYLAALTLPVTAGTAPDDSQVLVNHAFLRRHTGGDVPVGRSIRLARSGSSTPGRWMTIAGVVPDVRQTPMGDPLPCLYVPLAEEPATELALLLKTAGPPAASTPAVRDALRRLEAGAALHGVHTLDELSYIVRWTSRTIGSVIATFAVIAFLLAMCGLYAVTAHGVEQRSQEIGVHLALGARPSHVWRLVGNTVLSAAGLGLVVGAAGGTALRRVMRGLLLGESGDDVVTVALLALVVLLVALLACAVPARRASRIDPAAALRNE